MQIRQPEDFISSHRTIKHNHLYLVDDFRGSIPYGNSAGMGLYHLDTRFMSCFELRLHHSDPIPLLSSTEKGYLSTIVYTNGPIQTVTEEGIPISLNPETIQLKRETVLYGSQFERYTLVNYNSISVHIDLEISLGADFLDMFEIRGVISSDRSPANLPIMDTDGKVPVLIFSRTDGSNRHLQTGVRFMDVIPEYQGENRERKVSVIVFRLVLKPRQPFVINYEIQTVMDDHRVNVGFQEPQVMGIDQALVHLDSGSRRIRRHSTLFSSDNEDFDEMISCNQKDIQMLMTQTGEGSYIAAGIPWYVALFGRDSLITSRFCLPLDPRLARDSLKILARYQGKEVNPDRDEEPGKILHELRVGELARLGVIPHTPYYGSIDSTPLWIITLYEYLKWTHDVQTLYELWPNVLQAMSWIDQNLTRHTLGYSTYDSKADRGILQQGWKDSWDSIMDERGNVGRPPLALCEVQGYVYQAKVTMAEMAEYLEYMDLAFQLREEARNFKKRFNQDFWLDELDYFALALNEYGEPFRVVASNPGHLLESGILQQDRAVQVMNRLMSPDMFNGWGIRTLSANAVAHNPMSYHNGSVWPHDNAMVARGFARYKRPDLVEKIFKGLFEAARYMHYHRLPELFCGFRKENDPPVRYAVACSPQAWASASMFSILQSLLNIQPDAVSRTLSIIQPRLPSVLNRLSLNNLRVGDSAVDLEFQRVKEEVVTVAVKKREGDLSIKIEI